MLNFGGFLSSNFWTNYRCQTSASIEDLLNSKNCTVDKLLDDDDCLQELKNFNEKLIKYFDHDKLKVLIDYVTVMPTEADSHDRGHKYPFIAGEIFNCEINQILDKFFEPPVKTPPEPVEEDGDKKKDEDDSDTKDKDQAEDDESSNLPWLKQLEREQAEKSLDSDDANTTDKSDEPNSSEDAQPEQKKEPQDSNEQEEPKGDEPLHEEVEKDVNDNQTEEPVEKDKDESEETKELVDENTQDSNLEAKVDPPPLQRQDTPAPYKNTEEHKNSQEPEEEEQEQDKEDFKNAEPEAEETEIKKENFDTPRPEEDPHPEEKTESNDSTDPSMTQTTLATEATQANEDDEEDIDNKFVLLDRLFLFIEQEGDLNPVLSGYFAKLLSLLISRKQKLLIPYIFAPESKIIDNLVRHVGQKSISEVLNKLLTQIDPDYLEDSIQEKQQSVIEKIIAQLGPDQGEENNLNASSIIQDLFDYKDNLFYNILCQKENLRQIGEYACAEMQESTKASKTCSLSVLCQILHNHIEQLKKKDSAKQEKANTEANNEDDDMIVQQNSDDDKEEDESQNPNSVAVHSKNLEEVLINFIPNIENILKHDHPGETMVGSVSETAFVPLGQQRLRTVELVLKMIQLKNENIQNTLVRSLVFCNIIHLVKHFPWNNFLQLKVINMFTEVIENSDNQEFRKNFLDSSGIGKAVVEMSGQAVHTLESGRHIRSGFMGLVIAVSTKLQTRYDPVDKEKPEDTVAREYLDTCGEEWRQFVDDEYKRSTENNNKTLGGCSTKQSDNENEEEGGYDVQMEKIMQRFTNFNQILSQTSGNDEDDDDDEDGEVETDNTSGKEEGGGTAETFEGYGGSSSDSPGSPTKNAAFSNDDDITVRKVELKEQEDLDKDFVDHEFWKPQPKDDVDVDDLLAELES